MEDERGTASPEDAGQPDAGYQPPPPPAWSTPSAVPPPRQRGGGKMALTVGLTVVVVAGVAAGTVAATRGDDPAATAPVAAAKPAYDLRNGAVFVGSNEATGNRIVTFVRNANGTLKEIGRFATGGKGSGSFEVSSKTLVLGTTKGEASPTHLVEKAEYLYAANAGDSTITVFKILADKLQVVTTVPSGGDKPVSLTVSNDLLYVLNSGEETDQFIVGPQSLGAAAVLENCTTGQLPSVTGFRIGANGSLTQIRDSTRILSGERDSGCAQVQFTPNGRQIVVSERRQGKMAADKSAAKGGFVTYPVQVDGTLGPMTVATSSGNGPFGFTFLKDGTLLSTEQNGPNPGLGQVSSYAVNPDGSLTDNGPALGSGGTDTCWIVADEAQKLAFASSAMGGGAISSYSINKDGSLTLLHPAASAVDGRSANDGNPDGLTDLTLSKDGKYLYQLNSIFGGMDVYQVNSNGTLTAVEQHQVFTLQLPFQGGQLTPMGIAAL
jgi:6-phosphogluconolactonase (cycloisomerase 2 family)